MKNRLWLITVGIVGLAMAAPVAWYLASPLFINKVVEEEFPAQIPSSMEVGQHRQPKLCNSSWDRCFAV